VLKDGDAVDGDKRFWSAEGEGEESFAVAGGKDDGFCGAFHVER
jgi:hypothetical protein